MQKLNRFAVHIRSSSSFQGQTMLQDSVSFILKPFFQQERTSMVFQTNRACLRVWKGARFIDSFTRVSICMTFPFSSEALAPILMSVLWKRKYTKFLLYCLSVYPLSNYFVIKSDGANLSKYLQFSKNPCNYANVHKNSTLF